MKTFIINLDTVILYPSDEEKGTSFISSFRVHKDVDSFLRTCKEGHRNVCFISSHKKKDVQRIIEAFSLYCSKYYAIDDLADPKKDPDHVIDNLLDIALKDIAEPLWHIIMFCGGHEDIISADRKNLDIVRRLGCPHREGRNSTFFVRELSDYFEIEEQWTHSKLLEYDIEDVFERHHLSQNKLRYEYIDDTLDFIYYYEHDYNSKYKLLNDLIDIVELSLNDSKNQANISVSINKRSSIALPKAAIDTFYAWENAYLLHIIPKKVKAKLGLPIYSSHHSETGPYVYNLPEKELQRRLWLSERDVHADTILKGKYSFSKKELRDLRNELKSYYTEIPYYLKGFFNSSEEVFSLSYAQRWGLYSSILLSRMEELYNIVSTPRLLSEYCLNIDNEDVKDTNLDEYRQFCAPSNKKTNKYSFIYDCYCAMENTPNRYAPHDKLIQVRDWIRAWESIKKRKM